MVAVFSLKDQDQRILVEQVKLLYQSLLLVLLINVVSGAALLYGLWGVVSHSLLIIWMCGLMSVVVLRLSIYFFSTGVTLNHNTRIDMRCILLLGARLLA